MPQSVPPFRDQVPAAQRPAAAGPRTAELPRPQWQGLFVEPDVPPLEEDEG